MESDAPRERLIAIYDIHGNYDQLYRVMQNINPNPTKDKFIFGGDYIDRGPKSREVIQFLIDFSKFHNCVFLKGNHEDMFLGFLGFNERYSDRDFLHNGGMQTLESYGLSNDPHSNDLAARMSPKHLAFLQNLQTYHEDRGFVFVHAGLYPGESDPAESSEYERLWIQGLFLEYEGGWDGKTVVYGHTSEQQSVNFKKDRINMDSAAAYGGCLSACDVLSGEVWSARMNYPYWDKCAYISTGCANALGCTRHTSESINACGYHKYFEYLDSEYS